MLRNQICQKPFHLFCRQPPGIQMFPAAIFDQPSGYVVAKSLAVLSAVAGRQTITGFIKDLARQR